MDLLYKKKEENKNGVRVQPYRPPLIGNTSIALILLSLLLCFKHHNKLLGVSPPHQ